MKRRVKLKSSASPRVVLVTGASTGIGRATAAVLSARGCRVFGTSRHPDQHEVPNVTLLSLDVRDDQSVRACVARVIEAAGRLDVLVNNAGVSLGGAVEDASVAEVKALFETNVFGVHRMVKAVLPIMRAQKSGHIINISSLAGIVGVPYLGIYAASKHALEGYTESLRYEVKPFGIHISLIEPGDIATNLQNTQPEQPVADYGETRLRASHIHDLNVRNGPAPEVVAHAVLRAMGARSPRLRYTVTRRNERLVPLARRLIPHFILEWGMRDNYKLDE